MEVNGGLERSGRAELAEPLLAPWWSGSVMCVVDMDSLPSPPSPPRKHVPLT